MTTSMTSAAAKPLVQTLAMLSDGQIEAIRRIPPHEQSLSVASNARRPAAIFTDRARFTLEKQAIFARSAVPVAPAALVAASGSGAALDGYGMPLLVTRDRAGLSHVFVNACRHKGSRILERCAAVRGRMVCPYHAWAYGFDGKLIGVPRQETFAELDRAEFGLIELPSRETGGLIWAMLDRHAEPNFGTLHTDLDRDLDALGIKTAHIYGRKTFDLAANWKVVIEPFLEGYHVQRLHAQSVGPLFADVPNIVDRLGPHIRQISGKANFAPADLDTPGENIHKIVTHAYLVFPNTVIVTSPYYVSVMIVMPREAGRTIVDYYMLTRSAPDGPKAEDLYARSFEMILNVFGNEDFRAAESCQAGLASGAIDKVLYSGLESSIVDFHDEIERRL